MRAPDGSEGKKARCPQCKTVQTVPGTAAPPGESPLADVLNEAALSEAAAQPSLAAPVVQRPAPRPGPRQLGGAPPKLIVKRSKRPYIIAAMGLAALVVVGVAIIVILNSTSGKGGGSEIAVSPKPTAAAPAATPAPTAAPPEGPSPSPGATAAPTPTPFATPPVAVTPTPTATAAPTPLPTTAMPTPAPTISPINPLAYVHVVVSAIELTKIQVSRDNLITAKKTIDLTAVSEDKFPASAADISPPASPGDSKKRYVYVTGQSPRSPGTNILMYDPHPYGTPSVKMIVLLVDGTVRDMHIDDLKKQLAAQNAKADEIPK